MEKKERKSVVEEEKILEAKIRDYYNQYKELSQRCLKEIRQPGVPGVTMDLEGDKLYYFQPDIPFLESPEIQKEYRARFLSSISQVPPPPPFHLYPHHLQKIRMELIADRSNPNVARQDLGAFFHRRKYRLQHRKHKLLLRWAHLANIPAVIDKLGPELHSELNRIQMEFELATQREDRLAKEDRFSQFLSPEVPHSKSEQGGVLYAENPDQCANSNIRADDFTTFIRERAYFNQASRLARKVATSAKWLPHSKRYEIWRESRLKFCSYKEDTQARQQSLVLAVRGEIKRTLLNQGYKDKRARAANTRRFADSLAQPVPESKVQRILESSGNQYEQVPVLVDSLGLLKARLVGLAAEFGVSGNLELDHGHSFTYKIVVLFPHYFQMQVLKSTFEIYDKAPADDESVLMIQARNFLKMKSLDAYNPNLSQSMHNAQGAARKALFATVGTATRRPSQREESGASEQQQQPRRSTVSMDEKDICVTRVKQANWLPFVCFSPTITPAQQRQRSRLALVPMVDRLLKNAIDLLDVQDAAAVNAVLEESSSMHTQRAREKNPLRGARLDIRDPESIVELELKETLADEPPLPPKEKDWKDEYKKLKREAIAGAKLLETTPSHFVKVLYLMQHLKARDHKIRLLSYLNFFRAVQRRFALDMREFGSRERVMPDAEFVPPSTEGAQEPLDLQLPTGVKDDESDEVSLTIGGGNTPRDSVSDDSKGGLKTGPEEDLVTLRKFKHKGKLNLRQLGSCPVLARIHAATDAQTEERQWSENWIEEKLGKDARVRQLGGRMDRVFFTNDQVAHVVDDFRVNVFYDIALQDMVLLEEELLRVGSHYITQHEVFAAMQGRPARATIDRAALVETLLLSEADYYLEKVKLIQTLLDVYENVCDPLEQMRVIQRVTDVMATRPLLDLEASYFQNSYRAATDAVRSQRLFYQEMLRAQYEQEKEVNSAMWRSMEAKCRKIEAFCEGRWRPAERSEHLDLLSSKGGGGSEEEPLKHAGEEEEVPARKHLSKYAHETLDFAKVLGIPSISAESILDAQDEKEPLVLDAVGELTTYNKHKEGLPQKLQTVDQNLNKFGVVALAQCKVGFLDFYESMGALTRLFAATLWGFEELERATRPESGMASSCLECSFYQFCHAELKLLRAQHSEHTPSEPGLRAVEEGLVFDNPDVLEFAARDLCAELSGDFDLMDPFHVAKLDLASIGNFPFPEMPHVLEHYLPDGDVDESKPKVKLTPGGKEFRALSRQRVGEQLSTIKRRKYRKVQAPSLLRVCCNIMEAVRLREHLIDLVFETGVVSGLYGEQRRLVNKGSEEPILADSIHFESFSGLSQSEFDFVEHGYNLRAPKAQFGNLAFLEFDVSLKNCLLWSSIPAAKCYFLNQGLEELRAITAYQAMHTQALIVAVQHNHAIMEYHLRATAELAGVASKDEPPFLVPNRVANVDNVLSRSGDNINQDGLKRERDKLKTNLVKEVADIFMLVNKKKARSRVQVAKKLQIFHNKIAQKVKGYAKLRLLRSYKLKLLHAYCHDILREVYHDALKVQAFELRNALARAQFQMPSNSLVFSQKPSAISECLPVQLQGLVPASRDGLLYMQKVEDLFKLPSVEEIARLVTLQDDDARALVNCQNPFGFNDEFDERDPELTLREAFAEPPTPLRLRTTDASGFKGGDEPGEEEEVMRLPRFKRVQMEKGDFQEAWGYGNRVFQVTRFLFYMHKLFELEMFSTKALASSPAEVLELDEDVARGFSYWERLKDERGEGSSQSDAQLYSALGQVSPSAETPENWRRKFEYDPETGQPATAARIVELITEKRRKRINLSDDLLNAMTGLSGVEKEVLKERASQSVGDTCDVMEHLYEKKCILLYLALMRMREEMRDFKEPPTPATKKRKYRPLASTQAELASPISLLSQTLAALAGQVEQPLLTYHNAFNVSRSILAPKHLNFHEQVYTDYSQFQATVQPMVDEQTLMPPRVQLVSKLHAQAICEPSGTNFMGHVPGIHELPDTLRQLLGCFGTGELRHRLANRVALQDQDVEEQLEKLRLVEAATPRVKVWHLQRDYATLCILAMQMKDVMLSWIACRVLPDEPHVYQQCEAKFKQLLFWRINAELQRLDYLLKRQKKKREDGGGGMKVTKPPPMQAMRGAAAVGTVTGRAEPTAEEQINVENVVKQLKAQIRTVVAYLSLELLRAGEVSLRREIGALAGAFEVSSKEMYALVHPQQQFASTVLQNVDRNSHLDVVQKVGPVQSFLTRLKNRCTEVETLTSGPGLVFTLKDFNDCVRQMSKGLVKYCEVELKTRSETMTVRVQHLEHLLYSREQQVLELQRKTKQLEDDQERIVNAKIAERGNQVIYELDQSQRELRTLKDSIYTLENELRKALHAEYGASLRLKDVHIDNTERRFSDYKSNLTEDIKNFVLSSEKKILGNIEKVANRFQIYKSAATPSAPSRASMKQQQPQSRKHSQRRGLTPQVTFKTPSPYTRQLVNRQDYVWENSPLIEEEPEERERLQVYDESIREDYLQLHEYKRKLRIFWKFQFAVEKSRHERELKLMQKQMTSNACLWEQLAEGQKRESIIKQELLYTQQSLASCERIIDRLQSELDALQNDKLRLQQFKNNKSQRLQELEQRVRHLEVLENIDLRKVLEELRAREKALKNLQNLEVNFESRIDAVERRNDTKVKQLEQKYKQEEEMKREAMDKLDTLRAEVKQLEGYDSNVDNWKEKCRELFEICKDFESENRELRERLGQQDGLIHELEQKSFEHHHQQIASEIPPASILSGSLPDSAGGTKPLSTGAPASSIRDHLQRKMQIDARRSDGFSNQTRPSTEWNRSQGTGMNFMRGQQQQQRLAIGSGGTVNPQWSGPHPSAIQTTTDFNRAGLASMPLSGKGGGGGARTTKFQSGGPIVPIYEREGPTNRSGEGTSGLTASNWTTSNRTARLGTTSSGRRQATTVNPSARRSFVAAGSAIASSAPGGKRSVSTSLKDSPSFQKMQTVKEHLTLSSGHSSVKGAQIRSTGTVGMSVTGEAAGIQAPRVVTKSKAA